MTIAAPTIGTAVQGSTAATTVTLDFTSANTGDWCFAAVCLADSQSVAPTAPSGWFYFQGSEGSTGAASSRTILAYRKKQAGDTTQAFTWGVSCKFEAVPYWYAGVLGIEGMVYTAHASTANYVTGSLTPLNSDRWIMMVAHARGTTSLETWTPDGSMTERSDVNHGGTNPFVAVQIADTNTTVSQASHTYTAVCSVADSHGATIAVALCPRSEWSNNAEGGSNGTTITTGNTNAGSGEAASAVTVGTSATGKFDSTAPIHDTLSLTFATGGTATTSTFQWANLGQMARVWARVYIDCTAFTNILSNGFVRFRGGGVQTARVSLSSTGQIQLRDSANGVVATSTTVLTANSKARVNADIAIGASAAGKVDIYLTPESVTPTETLTVSAQNFGTNNIDEATFGVIGSVANAAAFGLEFTISNAGPLAPFEVDPTAIASTAAVGSPSVSDGSLAVAPTGRVATSMVGTPVLVDGSLAVSPTGRAATSGVGTPALADSARSFTITGITGAATVGSPALTNSALAVSATGIPSTTAVGSPSLADSALAVAPTGFAGTTAVGSPALTDSARTIAPAGIADTAVVGSPTLTYSAFTIVTDGIASTAAVGAPTVVDTSMTIAPAGIGPASQVGTPAAVVAMTVTPAGISTTITLGTPAAADASMGVTAVGIPSTATIGEPTAANQPPPQPGRGTAALRAITGAALHPGSTATLLRRPGVTPR